MKRRLELVRARARTYRRTLSACAYRCALRALESLAGSAEALPEGREASREAVQGIGRDLERSSGRGHVATVLLEHRQDLRLREVVLGAQHQEQPFAGQHAAHSTDVYRHRQDGTAPVSFGNHPRATASTMLYPPDLLDPIFPS